mmetsp:Transcript_176696/g.566627  ORF Transcript_176696/g.566627 Transcript_176696/m.566627 type:complete len:396 (-) Transcript_176696:1273-2460(-)
MISKASENQASRACAAAGGPCLSRTCRLYVTAWANRTMLKPAASMPSPTCLSKIFRSPRNPVSSRAASSTSRCQALEVVFARSVVSRAVWSRSKKGESGLTEEASATYAAAGLSQVVGLEGLPWTDASATIVSHALMSWGIEASIRLLKDSAFEFKLRASAAGIAAIRTARSGWEAACGSSGAANWAEVPAGRASRSKRLDSQAERVRPSSWSPWLVPSAQASSSCILAPTGSPRNAVPGATSRAASMSLRGSTRAKCGESVYRGSSFEAAQQLAPLSTKLTRMKYPCPSGRPCGKACRVLSARKELLSAPSEVVQDPTSSSGNHSPSELTSTPAGGTEAVVFAGPGTMCCLSVTFHMPVRHTPEAAVQLPWGAARRRLGIPARTQRNLKETCWQ